MQFIETLVLEFVPKWNANTQLDVLCISTSNPVYLVFCESEASPSIVVRVSGLIDIEKTHTIMEQLYGQVGDLIPMPIALTKIDAGMASIQKGVGGAPWFELASNYTERDQWEELRTRAIDALSRLHEGSFQIQRWQTICEPGNELRRCFDSCIESGTDLSNEVIKLVEVLADRLDSLGRISVYPQHGDYCLNNLIIDLNDLHVIDFEDFGLTSMPFHDEFTLALSMHAQANDLVRSS
ncbi:MAG: hypothetical protein COA42_22065, partial [Alteromonadaceae bacterium]